MVTQRVFLSWAVAAIVGLPIYSSLSYAADKHVHGQAEMFIIIENQQVSIELESPADNILGFEHTPNNAVEQQQLEKMMGKLSNYQALITINGSNCTETNSTIISPFTHKNAHHAHSDSDEHKHEHKHESTHGHASHHENDHADFLFSYTLQCDQINKVDSVDVSVFDTLERLEKLTVNWVVNDKQGISQLNRNQTTINLSR